MDNKIRPDQKIREQKRKERIEFEKRAKKQKGFKLNILGKENINNHRITDRRTEWETSQQIDRKKQKKETWGFVVLVIIFISLLVGFLTDFNPVGALSSFGHMVRWTIEVFFWNYSWVLWTIIGISIFIGSLIVIYYGYNKAKDSGTLLLIALMIILLFTPLIVLVPILLIIIILILLSKK